MPLAENLDLEESATAILMPIQVTEVFFCQYGQTAVFEMVMVIVGAFQVRNETFSLMMQGR